MMTLHVRTETAMGSVTSVVTAPDDRRAVELSRSLAQAGCVVALRPSTGGLRSVAELVALRDKALDRELAAAARRKGRAGSNVLNMRGK